MVDHERVVTLLLRMQQTYSFRELARRSGIGSAETIARVARRDGTLGAESVRKLALTYGAEFSFTEDELRRWSGLTTRGDAKATTRVPQQTPDPVPAAVRVGFQRAKERLTPEAFAALEALIANQVPMVTELIRSGKLGPTQYRSPDQLRDAQTP